VLPVTVGIRDGVVQLVSILRLVYTMLTHAGSGGAAVHGARMRPHGCHRRLHRRLVPTKLPLPVRNRSGLQVGFLSPLWHLLSLTHQCSCTCELLIVRAVRVHVSAGYNRVEGNRRASRNGRVSDLPPEIPTERFATFSSLYSTYVVPCCARRLPSGLTGRGWRDGSLDTKKFVLRCPTHTKGKPGFKHGYGNPSPADLGYGPRPAPSAEDAGVGCTPTQSTAEDAMAPPPHQCFFGWSVAACGYPYGRCMHATPPPPPPPPQAQGDLTSPAPKRSPRVPIPKREFGAVKQDPRVSRLVSHGLHIFPPGFE
jgi:hypothetical protein